MTTMTEITSAQQSGEAANLFDERKELKYLLTYEQYSQLMAEIGSKLEDDQYPKSTISSLYYDTPECLMINPPLGKCAYKEKIRVRAYGAANADTPVFVELKKKFKGTTYKRRVRLAAGTTAPFLTGSITYNEAAARSIARGALDTTEPEEFETHQTAEELVAATQRHPGVAPRMMITVDRLAKRTTDGSNLRVTFDRNIRWRDWDLAFSRGQGGVSLFPEGRILMEVKCSTKGAYPLWFSRTLTKLGLFPQPCSKVALAYQASLATHTTTLKEAQSA